ncbi:MAG: DEAD/DEAH box helicase [Paracoccaceae bacterium]
MLLRPYQEAAVDAACEALDKHRNTIVVAPTGAGKTIMLSALVGKRHRAGKKVLVMQHRDELVDQNKSKFEKINPYLTTSIVNGTVKHWDGDAVFSMVQTISREKNMAKRPAFDMVVIDESHHAAADTYVRVIKAVKEDNPNVEIVGFTATPNRGDGKGLRKVFNNCSHQIEITTLIREGFLVPPKTYVVDCGVRDQLNNVKRKGNEFDMDEVESIMNRRVINNKVVEEWFKYASDRKTVVFCSTIKHAEDLTNTFLDCDVNAELVTGETPKPERAQILHDLAHGDVQVVVNVAVLTEGFDAPPVSCVVLTRPCSQKGTMVQMIGRGLRTVNPEEFPDVVKTDCIVLDFGTSVFTHGSLEDSVNLDDREKGEAQTKECPSCGAEVPLGTKICQFCGHEFIPADIEGPEELVRFNMTEYDLMQMSPFLWMDLFGDGCLMVAMGFEGFVGVANTSNLSISFGKRSKGKLKVLSVGQKVQAMAAADDFLREIEDTNAANKTKRWLSQRATQKQVEHLLAQGVEVRPMDLSWTKYKAACMLSFMWNRGTIEYAVEKYL